VFHYHYQWTKTNARARNQRALEEHLDYISALFSRNPAAIEKACRQHLKSARETLLQSIQEPA
ncbi:MAG: GntR family transcriptional regulator, partial [Allorhizobium sp.]